MKAAVAGGTAVGRKQGGYGAGRVAAAAAAGWEPRVTPYQVRGEFSGLSVSVVLALMAFLCCFPLLENAFFRRWSRCPGAHSAELPVGGTLGSAQVYFLKG